MLSRFVIWGLPQTPYGASRGQQINFQVQKLSNPYDPPTPVPPQNCCFSSGGFFSCVFPSLFVLVLLFLACPFPSVVWLVWLCLVVAVPGCCVLLLVRSLALWCGVVLFLVVVLLPLPSWFRGWLALWCGFVLAGVLFLVSFGLSLCLLCAESFLGVRPPFFLRLLNWLKPLITNQLYIFSFDYFQKV